jgi:hypothetical protein
MEKFVLKILFLKKRTLANFNRHIIKTFLAFQPSIRFCGILLTGYLTKIFSTFVLVLINSLTILVLNRTLVPLKISIENTI